MLSPPPELGAGGMCGGMFQGRVIPDGLRSDAAAPLYLFRCGNLYNKRALITSFQGRVIPDGLHSDAAAPLYLFLCGNLYNKRALITSFYGSSCAKNGKDALNTPETLPLFSSCVQFPIFSQFV
eukprot:1182959-Prorocentrum_minimum.AAC.4